MSLLITAFGRFDDGPNCSEALLRRLETERPALEGDWGGEVALALLEVDTETIGEALAALLERRRPTHLLLTGQAAGRDAVSLERTVRNRRALAVPDAAGRTGDFGVVAAGGPELRRATWPDLDGVAAAIAAAGVPARVSDDAGSHLCNQTLYLALGLAEAAESRFVATFLHLPLIPEQVAAGVPAARRIPGCFALPLDDMTRAVRAVLRHTRATR